MNTCNMKGFTRSDKPTKNYHQISPLQALGCWLLAGTKQDIEDATLGWETVINIFHHF